MHSTLRAQMQVCVFQDPPLDDCSNATVCTATHDSTSTLQRAVLPDTSCCVCVYTAHKSA